MKDSLKPKTAVKPPYSPMKQGRPPHGAARAQGRSGASREESPSAGSPVASVASVASVAMALPTASTDLLRGIVEMAPDAIVVVGQESRILLVNRQTEALFGYTRDELLGQILELLVPEHLRQAHVQHRARYSAAPRTRPMGVGLALTGRRKDGSEFPVEISLAHLQTTSDQLVIASVRDISERKRLEQALHTAEQQAHAAAEAQRKTLETLIDELPSAVCLVLGTDARLALANRALTDVWGAQWAVGQPMLEFLTRNGIQVLQLNGKPLPRDRMVVFRAVRDGESVRQHQQIVRHPDGTLLPVVVNAILLKARDLYGLTPPGQEPVEGEPEPPMALIVYQDVSALKEAERVKDEFVALAAHELRNPMAALKGFATMLQPDDRGAGSGYAAEVEELQADAVQEIQRATDRLVALTDDLLDVTRLQAGRLELHPEPHDLVALARRVVKRLAVTTESHTIRVAADADYLVVDIDVRRMEQVVTNLLNNAIKYMPDGGEIAVTLRGDPTGYAELSVQDSGIGIPEAEQGRVFGRFARAANARAQGIHGTGLGLYLCRELVERHGGRIWFDSEEGNGSTFAFALPLASEADEA